MFTKFEFLRSPDEGSNSIKGPDSGDPPVAPLDGGLLDGESSCNMWHLFNYFDESCVDLTEVYNNGSVRAAATGRNCSTPAPGGPPTASVTVSTASGSIFDNHEASSGQRSSYGGAGSDAHDASWMCVVNMADLHSQDSSAADLRHFEAAKGTASPQRSASRINGNAVSSIPNCLDGELVQFTASSSVKQETGTTTVTTMRHPSIVTLSDFKDFRVHIKQEGDIKPTTETLAQKVVTSGVGIFQSTTRPILVLKSCHPVATTTTVEKPSKAYPKPAYSYSCLIAMALKNSLTGVLPVNEIYAFMTDHFPYFQTAPDGWKNSVRHNLSLNKCFRKIDNPNTNGHARKGCLWGLNESRILKMDEEIIKWRKKDPEGIRRSMVHPECLEAIEKGNINSSIAGGISQINASNNTALVFNDDVLVDVYTEPADVTLVQRVYSQEDFLDELVGRGERVECGAPVKSTTSLSFIRSTARPVAKTVSSRSVIGLTSSPATQVVSRSAYTIKAEIG